MGFRFAAVLLLLLAAVLPDRARAASGTAGGLVFSDERGGFRLISVSGSGTTADPIVLVEEITSLRPAVLVIRRNEVPPGDEPALARALSMSFVVIKVVINRSERVWAGFDLELQEILNQPSPYGDGLSFDQMGSFKEGLSSDRFAIGDRISEPYDRLRFFDGSVDHGSAVTFKFHITDPTPKREFYLVQEPRLLIARLPGRRLAGMGGRRTMQLKP